MEDLKALVRGLTGAFIAYYNHQCPAEEENRPPYLISEKQAANMLSDRYLNGDDLNEMLTIQVRHLEQYANVSHRLSTLTFLKALIVRLNTKLNTTDEVNWKIECRAVSKALVVLYELRYLESGKTYDIKYFGEQFSLNSTAYYVNYTPKFIGRKSVGLGTCQFAKELSDKVFYPLTDDLFKSVRDKKGRAALIKSKVKALFVPYSPEIATELNSPLEQDVRQLDATNNQGIFSHRYVQDTWHSITENIAPIVSRFNPWGR
jgi:hypothetical protein